MFTALRLSLDVMQVDTLRGEEECYIIKAKYQNLWRIMWEKHTKKGKVMDENYLKCKVCGRKIDVNEVGGWGKGIDENIYCYDCAYKTDSETNKPEQKQ